MSNFRRSQNQSNPNKLNAILSTLIFILILNVTMQIWLLYVALNNALDNNKEILIPAFVASLILFIIGISLLYYLPTGNRNIRK
ncbi:DUF6755 family protein [Flavobacterium seoulense]|uniref:Uncharacterized protein n=1 Tax=Flavobacterium seoulense TaxID=1492738 RepID=A0A066WLL2_9FLAO|nr:DUF6755 family protein [Flavobacterium seoulense]KDN54897.1 hypothetical protein FEM21_19020 [Flavobacterium seoulense]